VAPLFGTFGCVDQVGGSGRKISAVAPVRQAKHSNEGVGASHLRMERAQDGKRVLGDKYRHDHKEWNPASGDKK